MITMAGQTQVPFVQLNLTCSPVEVQAARRAAREAMKSLGYRDLADGAQTIASELVTNAINIMTERKLWGRIILRIFLNEGRPLIEVWDPIYWIRPQPKEMSLTEQNGRGLLIVEAYSTIWGSRVGTLGDGVMRKCTWALLK